MERYVIMW